MATPIGKTFKDVGEMQQRRHNMTARGLGSYYYYYTYLLHLRKLWPLLVNVQFFVGGFTGLSSVQIQARSTNMFLWAE